MKNFQFSCAVRIDNPSDPHHGDLQEIVGLLTPIVEANTITEAYYKQAIIDHCNTNKCTIYKVVLGK